LYHLAIRPAAVEDWRGEKGGEIDSNGRDCSRYTFEIGLKRGIKRLGAIKRRPPEPVWKTAEAFLRSTTQPGGGVGFNFRAKTKSSPKKRGKIYMDLSCGRTAEGQQKQFRRGEENSQKASVCCLRYAGGARKGERDLQRK